MQDSGSGIWSLDDFETLRLWENVCPELLSFIDVHAPGLEVQENADLVARPLRHGPFTGDDRSVPLDTRILDLSVSRVPNGNAPSTSGGDEQYDLTAGFQATTATTASPWIPLGSLGTPHGPHGGEDDMEGSFVQDHATSDQVRRETVALHVDTITGELAHPGASSDARALSKRSTPFYSHKVRRASSRGRRSTLSSTIDTESVTTSHQTNSEAHRGRQLCPIPGCGKLVRVKDHMKYHFLKKDCPLCGQKCADNRDLERHLQRTVKHAGRNILCRNNCGKRYARLDAMDRHAKNSCRLRVSYPSNRSQAESSGSAQQLRSSVSRGEFSAPASYSNQSYVTQPFGHPLALSAQGLLSDTEWRDGLQLGPFAAFWPNEAPPSSMAYHNEIPVRDWQREFEGVDEELFGFDRASI